MSQGNYDGVQKSAFGSLVKEGVYDVAFDHRDPLRDFFQRVFSTALDSLDTGRPVSIIDCGCGPGAWLDLAYEICETRGEIEAAYYGFDLTPEMVQVAAQRVAGKIDAAHLKQGDLMDDSAYQFAGHDNGFDLIFTYDVIQQLPRSLQLDACRSLSDRLAENGVMIIFDHDCQTRFGRKMGIKKFITRYSGIELVPRYYCNARYPKLTSIARHLEATGRFITKIHTTPDSPKRALLAKRLKA